MDWQAELSTCQFLDLCNILYLYPALPCIGIIGTFQEPHRLQILSCLFQGLVKVVPALFRFIETLTSRFQATLTCNDEQSHAKKLLTLSV